MPMTLMKNLLRNRKKKTASKEKRSVSGISYTLERKQITRLHLYVKPPYGEVLVTAPVTYTDSEIESFIISKADWIRKHAEKFRERPAQAKMALRYESGEVLYFWGKPYVLTVIEEPERKRSRLVLDPEPEFGVSREDLIEYTKGDSIEPHLLKALKDSFDFYRSMVEEDTFELLMNQSWKVRCEWLTENASTILIRDKDWDKIFADIEENEMSFSRYYPMVRVKADCRDLVYMIIALVLNDDLYDFCIKI